MEVRWLRAALTNLDDAGAYIAADSPDAAIIVIARIRAAVEQLSEHPALGQQGRIAGTRELVISGTPFIVPYRIKGDTVEILRVLHGARRWPKRL